MTGAIATLAAYCRSRSYPEPVGEFRFHPSRRWRFDAAFPEQMLAVEFQGGGWTGGRHVRGKGFEGDCEKFSTAAAMGWRVMLVTPDQVANGLLFSLIDYALRESR